MKLDYLHVNLYSGSTLIILKMPLKSVPYLKFQSTQPKDNLVTHDIPGKLWETVGVDISTFHNKTYLCIVEYYRKFLVVKQMDGILA